MNTFIQFSLVIIGGGIGAGCRHGLNVGIPLFLPQMRFIFGIPAGVLLVNTLGSFLMGLLIGWLTQRSGMTAFLSAAHWRLLLGTGFLGGFTTFSAFSLDTVILLERHHFGYTLVYTLGSVTLGILALFLGLWCLRASL